MALIHRTSPAYRKDCLNRLPGSGCEPLLPHVLSDKLVLVCLVCWDMMGTVLPLLIVGSVVRHRSLVTVSHVGGQPVSMADPKKVLDTQTSGRLREMSAV